MSTLRTSFLTTACVLLAAVAVEGDEARVEFFESQIRPVLVEHCYKCHSQDAKNVRGGLLLDSEAGIQHGGESGPTVVPGKPDDSLLLSSLKHESYEMPPDRKLPDHVISDFEKWIQDGAVDPRKGGTTITRDSIDLEEGRKFWCFQPVAELAIPKHDSNWPKSPIDGFISARHQAAGLTPAEDAPPEHVLRRLYFELIGLPPNPDQISEFLVAWSASPDDAIAATTEELLASSHFGERWGRHWLDVARFAESSGGGRSLMFSDAWRFRDYVIKSFNDDKPFDTMIREHIAGDLLPHQTDKQHDEQVTGVGYLTLGPTNYEQQDKELLRMEVVDEQVDTIGRTFLGLTLGCARCHDHKFDPIPTTDYYAMAGIFRSTKTLTPGNVSGYVTTNLKAGSHADRLAAWQQKQQVLQTKIKSLRKQVRVPTGKPIRGIDPRSLPGIVIDDEQAIFEGQWVHSTSQAPYVGNGYRHDDFKKSGCRVTFSTTLPKTGEYEVRLCHNYHASRCKRLPVVIHHAAGSTTVDVNQEQRPPDGTFAELGRFQFAAGQPAVITIDAEESEEGVVIVDAIQFLPVVTSRTKADDAEQQELARELNKLEQQLQQLEKVKPTLPKVMSVHDQAKPGDWHVHVRGGIRNLGDIVERGFVTVATDPKTPTANIPDNRSGRLELAKWIASPQNPLTARVYVNRVWLHLIGEGIVRTPDNFGRMGQLPSHPQLLDYLSAKFVTEDGWSTKALIRRIVNARVFRLSSTATEQHKLADPENRLLTRGFRRRLEAEPLRDAILQISGELDHDTTGGLTIRKIVQYDNGYDHDADEKGLRSVYIPFFRNSMLETLVVFDVANPNLVSGKRAVSTLPTQALFLLNSPFVLKQSQLAAQRFLSTQTSDPAAVELQIDQAYLTVLGRKATNTERETIMAFLNQNDATPTENWTAVFQSLFASMDFRYVD